MFTLPVTFAHLKVGFGFPLPEQSKNMISPLFASISEGLCFHVGGTIRNIEKKKK